jgi:hypothetical protein
MPCGLTRRLYEIYKHFNMFGERKNRRKNQDIIVKRTGKMKYIEKRAKNAKSTLKNVINVICGGDILRVSAHDPRTKHHQRNPKQQNESHDRWFAPRNLIRCSALCFDQ